MTSINEDKVKEDWHARGFSTNIWRDPPGQVWADFKHDVDELFMLLEGEVILEMNGEIIYSAIGQEILIPANTLHTVKNIGSTESCWLYGYQRK